MKKQKYNPKITFKKGAITTLSIAIISLILDFITTGNITFGNSTIAAIILGIAKMIQNYLKNK